MRINRLFGIPHIPLTYRIFSSDRQAVNGTFAIHIKTKKYGKSIFNQGNDGEDERAVNK